MRLSYIVCVILIEYVASFEYDGSLNIKLLHTLNCNHEKYCTRGVIAAESIRLGSPNIEQISFNQQHLKELKEASEIDGFYTVKSLVTTADKREMEFLSSVKARSFLESGLTDIINVWMLPNGEVIAVNIQVTNSSSPFLPKGVINGYIDSNVYLHHIDQAPVMVANEFAAIKKLPLPPKNNCNQFNKCLPDTASYIQKLEREREAREKGEVKDNRSFLAKYWMYIVPIAIFVMLSGASNPEAPAQANR